MKCKSYTFLACLVLLLAEIAAAQEHPVTRISGNYQSTPLKEVLGEIEEKFHLTFSYIDQLVDSVFVTAAFQNKNLFEALEIILKNTHVSFKISNANNIILFQAKEQPQKKFDLSGKIIDQQTGESLPYVNVVVRGILKGAASDSFGFYKIEHLEPNIYEIDFAMLGYKKSSKRIRLFEDMVLNVTLEQQPLELQTIEITPAVIEISAEEPSMQVLSSEEILASANFQQDIYRSVQILPGIANTDFSAKPHIKGGNPDETAVFLDNMPIFEPFLLEDVVDGAVSIINTEPVKHIKLLTGGFSAKYPEKMSGVIDVNTIDSVREHALKFTFDRFFTSLFFNKEINSKANYFLTTRRSIFDLWPGVFTVGLPPDFDYRFEPKFGSENELMPVTFDLWNKLDVRINSNHSLSCNFLYAIDHLDLLYGIYHFQNEYVNSSRKSAHGWINWTWLANRRFSSTNTLGFQNLAKDAQFSLDPNVIDETHDLNFDRQNSVTLTFRQQNIWQAAKNHLLEFGFDFHRFRGKYFYDEIRLNILETTSEKAVFDTLFSDTNLSGHTLSGYLQDTWKISNRLHFLPGARVSQQSFTGKPQFAPRSALRISLSNQLNLKLAYGWFYQPDNFHKPKTYLGRTTLDPEPEKCLHYVGSLAFAKENLSFDFNVYFKNYVKLNDDFRYDLHNRLGEFGIVDVPFHTKRGASKGLDFFVRGKHANGSLFSLAYSFSRSRMTDALGTTVPRNFDRMHSISMNSVIKLKHHWTINALWRFHSGDPFTPAAIQVLGDSTWYNSHAYFKTETKNSGRLPSYHSLDMKIQKEWQLKSFKLIAYLNILNVYDRPNVREIGINHRVTGSPQGTKVFELLPIVRETFIERMFAPGVSVQF